jgi:hypothetical protein
MGFSSLRSRRRSQRIVFERWDEADDIAKRLRRRISEAEYTFRAEEPPAGVVVPVDVDQGASVDAR